VLRSGDAIVVCVLGLLCVGVVMVNSAGLTIDPTEAVTFESIVWSRSTLYMLGALALMFVASRLPITAIAQTPAVQRAIPLLIPAVFLALLLVYVPGVGHEVNGSNRWIRVPGSGLTMQPSELAKWGMVFVLAWFGAQRAGSLHKFRTGLAPGLLLLGPVVALVAHEDLGTGVLIAATGGLLLVAAGARVWHLLAFAPLAAVGIVGLVIASPYRVQRLVTFLDPYVDPAGAGYHMIQSLVAVANGRVWGRGLGFGLQKFGYLPEDRTDFLFAVICEELGLFGAALVIAINLGILWAGVAIVRRQTSPFLRLLGLGVITTFSLQALINLTVVTGLAPTKGIALPLLSSGGTGWILTAGSLGLLVAMDRATRVASSAARRLPNARSVEPTIVTRAVSPAQRASAAA
jgi:cell division protein FtsW